MQENEKDKRLQKQLDFIREIDKEKEIFRQTYLADASRKENDAEHAWHMAIMTMLLSEYANEKIDVLKTVGMLLIHDIVEIDAGDTYAYDEAGKATQHEREQKAAERIYGLLPKEQGEPLLELWEEFEEKIWDYAFNNILKKHVESGNIIDDEGAFSAEAGARAKASERNGR